MDPTEPTQAAQTAEEPLDQTPVRPFSEFLLEHREGELHTEVSETLNLLVQQVVRTGRKGALTLTITVKPAGDMVAVVDDVKVKLPVVDRQTKSYFVDDHANLSRSNPLQKELPGLRSVPARIPATQAREVSA